MKLSTHSTLPIQLAALLLAASPVAWAQDHGGPQRAHASPERHGGQLESTKAHRFEVVFLRDAVRVYAFDSEGEALDSSSIRGSVKLEFDAKGKRSQKASFAYVAPEEGSHDSGYMQASIDLTEVPDGGATAKFKLKGLASRKERSVSFELAFSLARLVEFECPMKCVPASDEAGKCPRCGMNLARKTFIFACSMHPKVVARTPQAACWICGMDLVKTEAQGAGTDPQDPDEHGGQDQGHDHSKHSH